MTVIKIKQQKTTRITNFAFLERFTDAEAVAIDLASIDDINAPQEQRENSSMLRRMNKKIDTASFIDLADPQTIAGIKSLAVIELITDDRATEILESPILQHELLD